ARWAAFFDMIGQPYRYEAVGYPVNGGAQWCVPDFVIPEPDGRVHIVDVKGTLIATDKAHERRGWLCDLSKNRPSVARATMIFGPFPGPALKSSGSQVFSYVAGERDYAELFAATQGLPRDKAARRARSAKFERLEEVWPPPSAS